jgi:hypothetical protein
MMAKYVSSMKAAGVISIIVLLYGCANAQKAGEQTYAACMNAGYDSYYCQKEAKATYNEVAAKNQKIMDDYQKTSKENRERDARRREAYIERTSRKDTVVCDTYGNRTTCTEQ